MATTIVDQVVEYDKSARAWAQLRTDGSMAVELVRYHDDKESAILAALPDDLRKWAEDTKRRRPRLGKRPLKAAVIVATDRVRPSPRFAEFYDVLGDSGTTYQVSPAARVCNCEDNRRGHYCKHLLAARYVERQARQNLSLWDLAQEAVEKHKHDEEWEPQIIWKSSDGTRYASIVQGGSGKPDDPLFLVVSGSSAILPIGYLDYDPWPEARWTFVDDPESYREWCKKISG